MLKQRNIFETISILSSCSCLLLVCFHYFTGALGMWLPVYVISIFLLSIYVSFRALQKLLALNAPIDYSEAFKDKRWRFVGQWIPVQRLYPKNPVQCEQKEYDTSELSIISTVLERRLVSSWYTEYVSQDIGFPFACKELLDHTIGRAFQISYNISTPALYTDVCSVLLSHLNEYKRAVKLMELSNEGDFQTHYRMMHPVHQEPEAGNKCPPAEHSANILRAVMKELIPIELRDTPHSELLVRILTKRLDAFINDTLSDPNWLNQKLLQLLNQGADNIESTEKANFGKTEIPKDIKTEKAPVPEVTINAPDSKKSESVTPITTTIESALSVLVTKTTAPILQNVIVDDTQDTTEITSDIKLETVRNDMEPESNPMDIQASPVLRQRRGRQGKNEVKIYDRIIEGSVKTWDSDMDLRCISVGQDLLASLDGEISLSRLWESDNAEGTEGWSPNPPQNKSPPALWFGEEDTMDLELDGSPPKLNVRAEPPPNFTLSGIHNMRDLQSTVNHAKHKIGDLQDEAAGMMEGILDFGLAGIKKGLRLTGLHEGQLDKLTTPSGDRTPPGTFPQTLPRAENGLHKHSPPSLADTDLEEVNNTSGTSAYLMKQHHVTSQDSVPCPIPGKSDDAGGTTERQEGESPEPEYEEAADFASSIAKLRSLLQQRTADTPPKQWVAEGAWWEAAEETRGRTQLARHAARPVDAATLADEYDVSADRSPVPEQSTNNMQRLDKLFQRTVTGVLNSIKTAVGGEGEEAGAALETPPGDWQYACGSLDLGVGGSVARLVATRRALAVDAALDPLQQAAARAPAAASPPLDLEEWCSGPGACWAAAAELAAAAGLWRSHVAHALATVLLGDVAEKLIRAWLQEFAAWLRRQTFLTFEQMAREESESEVAREASVELDVEVTCDAILEKLPSLPRVFGSEAARAALRLGVASAGGARVNADVARRLLDVAALHATRAALAHHH